MQPCRARLRHQPDEVAGREGPVDLTDPVLLGAARTTLRGHGHALWGVALFAGIRNVPGPRGPRSNTARAWARAAPRKCYAALLTGSSIRGRGAQGPVAKFVGPAADAAGDEDAEELAQAHP